MVAFAFSGAGEIGSLVILRLPRQSEDKFLRLLTLFLLRFNKNVAGSGFSL